MVQIEFVSTNPALLIGRHAHPALLLQELKEYQAAQEFLHIVTILLRVLINMFEELHVTLLVAVEEIFVQTLHREGILDVLKGNAVALQGIEASDRGIIVVVTFSEYVSKTFCSSVLALDIADKRQTPCRATIKDYKGCIKLTPIRIDERLDEVTQTDTLASHISMLYLIIEQANTITVRGVNGTKIIPLFIVRSIVYTFTFCFQFCCMEILP